MNKSWFCEPQTNHDNSRNVLFENKGFSMDAMWTDKTASCVFVRMGVAACFGLRAETVGEKKAWGCPVTGTGQRPV
jgi:hypothetical protein